MDENQRTGWPRFIWHTAAKREGRNIHSIITNDKWRHTETTENARKCMLWAMYQSCNLGHMQQFIAMLYSTWWHKTAIKLYKISIILHSTVNRTSLASSSWTICSEQCCSCNCTTCLGSSRTHQLITSARPSADTCYSALQSTRFTFWRAITDVRFTCRMTTQLPTTAIVVNKTVTGIRYNHVCAGSQSAAS